VLPLARRLCLFFLCYFVFRSVGPLVALVVLNAELVRALRAVLVRALRAVRRRRRRLNIQKKPNARGAGGGCVIRPGV